MNPGSDLTVYTATDLAERVLNAARLAQPIYASHGWTWGGYSSPTHVPSVEEIADTIKDLYDTASTNGAGCSSSGRLSVSVDPDDGSIGVDVQLADLRDEIREWDDIQDAGMTSGRLSGAHANPNPSGRIDRAEAVAPLAEVVEECERNALSAEWEFAVIFADAAYWLRTLSGEGLRGE